MTFKAMAMYLKQNFTRPARRLFQPGKLVPVLALVTALLAISTPARADTHDDEQKTSCVAPGQWLVPGDGSSIAETRLLDDLAKRPVVLLGEAHTSAEHHRWQLHTLSALYGRNPNMVVGFESFPRVIQPILDRWSRGELSKKKFLELTRWYDVWRFDPELYMPLFHFVRMHRIPMRALNVERVLIHRISKEGRDAIPLKERRGIGTPLEPSEAYRESLEYIFGLHEQVDEKHEHQGEGEKHEDEKPAEKSEPSAEDKQRFERFVEGQTFWDRAMAEAIAEVRSAGGDPLVAAIVGRGHVEYGFGIPHQLTDLGINNAAVLLPWDQDIACDQLKAGQDIAIADAVFGVDEPAGSGMQIRPLLGVRIEDGEAGGEKGVKIIMVMKGSIAATTALKENDLIVEAAGLKTPETSDLVKTIRRQALGTWLPLTVLRDGERLEIIAKFPAHQKTMKHP